MKKALLFIAAAVASASAFAQPGLDAGLPVSLDKAYVQADLYSSKTVLGPDGATPLKSVVDAKLDSVILTPTPLYTQLKNNLKNNYIVTTGKLMVEKAANTDKVTGLTGLIFDPSTAFDPEGDTKPIGWEGNSDVPGQYKFSWSAAEKAIKVDFVNAAADGGANYKDFNFMWARTTGKKLFDKDVKVRDSIFGQFVDMTENTVIFVTVKAEQKLNLRCDIVDINGRVSNGSSPDIIGITPGVETELEFRFSNKGANVKGKTATTTLVQDWYNGDFFATSANRSVDKPTGKFLPPFYGISGSACKGMASLDMSQIAKINLLIDNANGGVKDDVKVLYIKKIVIGSKAEAQNFVDPLDKANTIPAASVVGLKGIAKKSIKAYAVGNAIKVEGKAKVYNTAGQIIAEGAESIEVPSKGIYRVVNAKGAKFVVVK